MIAGATGRRPDMLILHYTGMGDAGEALQWLCNPVSQVSSHYFVFENGHTFQLVPEERRAWHAGASHWAGETDINSCSIGIEIANPGHPGGLPDFSARADRRHAEPLPRHLRALARSRPSACSPIPTSPPAARSTPARNSPGAAFSPRAASASGPEPARSVAAASSPAAMTGQPVEALQAMFAMLGYGVTVDGIYDEKLEAVVAAFQRHWRQDKVDGIADASTITTLRDLLAADAKRARRLKPSVIASERGNPGGRSALRLLDCVASLAMPGRPEHCIKLTRCRDADFWHDAKARSAGGFESARLSGNDIAQGG